MKKIFIILIAVIIMTPMHIAFARTYFPMEKQHNTTDYYDRGRGNSRSQYNADDDNVSPEGLKEKPNQDIDKFKHNDPVENTFDFDSAYNSLIFDFIETDDSITIKLKNIYDFDLNVTVDIFYMDEDYHVIYEDKIDIGKIKINGKRNVEFKPVDSYGNKIEYYDYGIDFNIEQAK